MSANDQDVGDALDSQSGTGQRAAGISIQTFLASQPRTYLVPERERTGPSPAGLLRWIAPVFRTSNSEFIQKCGLDAFFFLRYLRMLLKIFLPLAFIILPILLPLNKSGGRDTNEIAGVHYNVSGLDQLAWGNVAPQNTDRYWAHLVLAVVVVVYVCAVFFDELRGYIRLRQAYLTSPQHRLRASATTVLVTAIPRKWLSVEALDNLYDVFPGGVRNIWINRNFDQLNEKVKLRNRHALALESAETELIKKCKKAQMKKAKADAKKAGKHSKDAENREKAADEERATKLAEGAGVSSGNPHQVAHTVGEALHNANQERNRNRAFIPVVTEGIGAVGQGVGRLGKTVLGGFKKNGNGHEPPPGSAPVPSTDYDPNIEHDSPNTGSEHLHVEHDDRYLARQSNSVEYDDSPVSEDLRFGPRSTDGAADSHGPEGRSWRDKMANPLFSSSSRGGIDRDEDPLTAPSPVSPVSPGLGRRPTGKRRPHQRAALPKEEKQDPDEAPSYPPAFNESSEDDDYGEPMWMKFIRPKDRETMRLPIFGWSWMPSLPLLGKKVDKIDHCRKEVARLNLEIEVDQQQPEKFPLMNSAFVQFNHQVAAHMACQSVSHHIPKQMAPRLVEISPDDVIWDNMSIKWWERYVRTFGVVIIVSAMVIGWAFPVAFTGLLSQLSYLEGRFSWLRWLSELPEWLISAIQGILPPLFLAILMALLPLILRFLTRNQGLHTGMAIELTVQNYFFAFLFVQLFLVVSISSSFSSIFNSFKDVTSVPEILAQNIPKAANYFFSYMVLQAMSVSAGALVQIFGLISWFILAPILDSTARMKWARTTNLNQMQWGTFFPVYTTLASIGLIYCVIAPLILVFNVLTFGLFWFVYRYNTLYVTKFRFDTGGLLFPKAINQLFAGIYVMEICLIGMFFLVRDDKGDVACEGQAICMIVVLILTVGFQYFLNEAFDPLFRYLPITLEEEATRRDEEFARVQRKRLGLDADDDDDDDGFVDESERTANEDDDPRQGDIELKRFEAIDGQKSNRGRRTVPGTLNKIVPNKSKAARMSWADRSKNHRSPYFGGNSDRSVPTVKRMREKLAQDTEAQGPSTHAIGRALFSGINDELEDLTPEERDQLVQRAFQHEALRMKRPVIWIPRDDIGVSDDEVFRTQRFSKHIWISNEYQALDGKCRTIFSRSPPDFSEVDLIQL
ncbi:hypothetical protein FQN54_001019 [Arachnomyces sp. PD_36]|nr:hypothetical protein FQN54_001019 [Arachnomyces sp. PD_36]